MCTETYQNLLEINQILRRRGIIRNIDEGLKAREDEQREASRSKKRALQGEDDVDASEAPERS